MKKNIISFLILTVLTIIAWHKIYFQSFLGEGYAYFDSPLDFSTFYRYDNLASIIYFAFRNIFFDNLQYYLLFIIISQVILCLLLYFLMFKITKSKLIAFLSGIFFSINYVTNFEMISYGFYQWFAQRVPNFIPTLISLIFYHKFLSGINLKSERKYLYYFFSLSIFLFSVFLAHYSILLLPFIVFYNFFYSLSSYKEKKSFIINFLLLIPFILGALIITSKNPYGRDQGFIYFILELRENLLKKTLFQLTMVTIPYDLLIFLHGYLQNKFLLTGKIVTEMFNASVIIFYLLTIFLTIKIKRNLGIVLLTLFSSMLAVVVFSLYTNPNAIADNSITSNRYLFPIGFLASSYLAIVIYVFLWRKNILARGLVLFFLIFYVFTNVRLIWFATDEEQYKHIISKNIRAYIKSISYKFKDNSLVVLPKEIGPHQADFLREFYGKKTMSFIPFLALTEKKASSFNQVKDFLFLYSRKEGKVVNLTTNYKEIFKQNNLIK